MGDQTKAHAFLASMRGRYIVSQALHVAIETLGSVEPPVMREESNIADMQYLKDTIFPLYFDIDLPQEVLDKVMLG
tara:strand:+ start:20 stop:247 length:228 start_codon:yes stop_codon:yes gene_type:complete